MAEYVEEGLIEAHHYDFQTKDDLLTPEIENIYFTEALGIIGKLVR